MAPLLPSTLYSAAVPLLNKQKEDRSPSMGAVFSPSESTVSMKPMMIHSPSDKKIAMYSSVRR